MFEKSDILAQVDADIANGKDLTHWLVDGREKVLIHLATKGYFTDILVYHESRTVRLNAMMHELKNGGDISHCIKDAEKIVKREAILREEYLDELLNDCDREIADSARSALMHKAFRSSWDGVRDTMWRSSQ